MGVDWANLPADLLRTIANLLTTSASDYIRFRAVCTTWRSSSPQTPTHLPTQPPWLLLPPPSLPHLPRLFFSLTHDKTHSLSLPYPPSFRRVGSSHGWLAFLHTPSGSLSLLNPITQSRLPLPSLSSFPDVVSFDLWSIGREYTLRSDGLEISHVSLQEMSSSFIKKIVLSSNPSLDQNYIVLAVLDLTGKLAWCRNGDLSWRYIDGAESFCEDVIFRDNLFYAINKSGNIAVCDVRTPIPRVSIIETVLINPGDLQYLATSFGDNLFSITRYIEFDLDDPYLKEGYKTTKFEVFRLNLSTLKWDPVRDLGDESVFLGENSTLVLSCRGLCGCRGNCIYFTDDISEDDHENLYGDPDSGIYDLGNGRIDLLPCCSNNSYSPRVWPPPIWVTPYPFL